jgi:hypothetical protein
LRRVPSIVGEQVAAFSSAFMERESPSEEKGVARAARDHSCREIAKPASGMF